MQHGMQLSSLSLTSPASQLCCIFTHTLSQLSDVVFIQLVVLVALRLFSLSQLRILFIVFIQRHVVFTIILSVQS